MTQVLVNRVDLLSLGGGRQILFLGGTIGKISLTIMMTQHVPFDYNTS